MLSLDFLRTFEVGYSSCYLQDAGVGTGGEFEAFHSHAEHVHRGGIRFGIVVEHLLGHHSVAVDSLVQFEALFLYLAGLNDALTYFFLRVLLAASH